MLLGVKVKNAILHMVYHKIFKISNASNKTFSEGEVVNFLQTDVDKILTL